MSGLRPLSDAGNAFEMGIGNWLNVEIVECGRQSEGLVISLNTFRLAEMFIGEPGYSRLWMMEVVGNCKVYYKDAGVDLKDRGGSRR